MTHIPDLSKVSTRPGKAVTLCGREISFRKLSPAAPDCLQCWEVDEPAYCAVLAGEAALAEWAEMNSKRSAYIRHLKIVRRRRHRSLKKFLRTLHVAFAPEPNLPAPEARQ